MYFPRSRESNPSLNALTPYSLFRLYETLELAEDMEIDIPHVWLYLAELITPILQEDGVPMGELFR